MPQGCSVKPWLCWKMPDPDSALHQTGLVWPQPGLKEPQAGLAQPQAALVQPQAWQLPC